MIIIGIDPGLATTGYGLIETKNRKKKTKKENKRQSPVNKLECLEYGTIKTTPNSLQEERLKKIYLEVFKLLRKYKPKVLAIESIYFFKNLKTAIPVSEAKGVVLLAAAKKKIRVQQFTPLQVKMGICGYGRAEKKQIQKVTKKILGLKEEPKPDDAADALAIAINCSNLINQG